MEPEATRLLVPFLGMMLLTLAVWLYMYVRRLTWLAANRPDNEAIDSPEKLNALIPDAVNRPSNNLKNLFELPVLFYALALLLYATGNVDGVYVAAAWGFVIFRALHSAIHCTINHVMARFVCYLVSSLLLWLMLIRATIDVFAR